MLEKELFIPIKEYFESLGYTVDGEVLNVDLVAIKDKTSVAVELKTSINFKVFEQAALRQKQIDLVYIAVPKQKNLRKKSFINKLYLLKRLGIGLIFVSESKDVLVYSDPTETFTKTKKLNKKNDIIRELNNRILKNNIGGTNKEKKLTSYKQDTLKILATLKKESPCKGSIVSKKSGIKNATNIMYNNYYSWFLPVKRGIYTLSEKGIKAYDTYKDEIIKITKKEEH